jgi:hypothetical protein
MKHLPAIALLLYFLSGITTANAQECNALIVRNVNIGGTHIVQTVSQVLVVRGNYSYSIELLNDDKGLRAKIISKSGVEFNQEDEIIFVDSTMERRSYRFVEMGEMITDGSVPIYQNVLQLNMTAVEWLAASFITTIYIRNNVSKEMRKFTVNPNRQSEFRQLATCFYQTLDPSKVVDVKIADTDGHDQLQPINLPPLHLRAAAPNRLPMRN